MFERFNEKAVKVIMLAQAESRRLGHNFVGTEQILLGLIREGTGIAADVLTLVGIDLERARLEVERLIGRGSGDTAVEIPFTPRAKAVLDMAGEIALELGYSNIGTEHLLLGIGREGKRIVAVMGREPNQSLAFQVLQTLGIDPISMDEQVMQSQGFGAEIQEEQFSLQPFKERLRTLLPPMSDQALKVWHAMSSQISWEDTDTTLNRFWIQWLTRLSESEIQSALAELLALGVIERIEFA
jgi:ATP-dependent Clp protease ATP-binding subunit ClpA